MRCLIFGLEEIRYCCQKNGFTVPMLKIELSRNRINNSQQLKRTRRPPVAKKDFVNYASSSSDDIAALAKKIKQNPTTPKINSVQVTKINSVQVTPKINSVHLTPKLNTAYASPQTSQTLPVNVFASPQVVSFFRF